MNVGSVLAQQGKYDAALVEQRRALAIQDKALGSEHPAAASTRSNIAATLAMQGKLEDALQFYVQPIYEGPAADEPPDRFWSCKSGRAAARILEQQQQWREAVTWYERLAATCPDLKSLAEDSARKIRVQHPSLLFQ